MKEADMFPSCHSPQLHQGLEGMQQSSRGFTDVYCKVRGLFLSSKCETWPVRQEPKLFGMLVLDVRRPMQPSRVNLPGDYNLSVAAFQVGRSQHRLELARVQALAHVAAAVWCGALQPAHGQGSQAIATGFLCIIGDEVPWLPSRM